MKSRDTFICALGTALPLAINFDESTVKVTRELTSQPECAGSPLEQDLPYRASEFESLIGAIVCKDSSGSYRGHSRSVSRRPIRIRVLSERAFDSIFSGTPPSATRTIALWRHLGDKKQKNIGDKNELPNI